MGLDVATFDSLPAGAQVRAVLRRENGNGGNERLAITVSRAAPTARPLVVAIPPATYGRGGTSMGPADSRFPGEIKSRKLCRTQDLAILRPAVIVLEPRELSRTTTVPIACASFPDIAPGGGAVLPLTRYARGSEMERLLCSLCAGEPADDRAAQLAIWIVKDDISPADLLQEGRPLLTWGRNLPIGQGNGPAALELLRRAGLKGEGRRFFQVTPAVPPGPGDAFFFGRGSAGRS